VAIPALTESGWLPPGRHPATLAEVEAAFVVPFPESRVRRSIYDSWNRYRQTLLQVAPGVVVAFWLNGSFISAKPNPSDIDVVVLLDGPAFDALPQRTRHAAGALLKSESVKLVWAVHSHPLLLYPPSDPRHSKYVRLHAYWDEWWGHTVGGMEKGYLELQDER
jgi:hypothetical protein